MVSSVILVHAAGLLRPIGPKLTWASLYKMFWTIGTILDLVYGFFSNFGQGFRPMVDYRDYFLTMVLFLKSITLWLRMHWVVRLS